MHDIAKIYRNVDALRQLYKAHKDTRFRVWNDALRKCDGDAEAARARLAHEYRARRVWEQRERETA